MSEGDGEKISLEDKVREAVMKAKWMMGRMDEEVSERMKEKERG